jgi:hypothetical protein
LLIIFLNRYSDYWVRKRRKQLKGYLMNQHLYRNQQVVLEEQVLESYQRHNRQLTSQDYHSQEVKFQEVDHRGGDKAI